MGVRFNPKIVGSCLIGFALVAGSYVITNFGEPRIAPQPAAVVEQTEPIRRVAIPVEDKDKNGLEDWRDALVTTEITTPDTNIEPFEMPDTVTAQAGISLIEGIISSKVYAPFSSSPEEVVESTVASLEEQANLKLYELTDIDIMPDWDDEDIVNYANTMASIIRNNSVPDIELEMFILEDVVSNDNYDRLPELEILRGVYQAYRDDSLLLPVPEPLAKAHLDIINTYNAIYEDIDAFTMIETDPAVSLVHLRRYSDDALGLRMSLENMYEELAEYGELFTADDPALWFVLFSPDYQPNL